MAFALDALDALDVLFGSGDVACASKVSRGTFLLKATVASHIPKMMAQ